jgi:TonB-linked SusC/RagA family outer membrane protein
VADATGEPVIGANVVIKGTSTGVITDINGKFEINVPDKAVLVISYIGYINSEITPGNQSDLRVTLRENALGLDEVVVVGYGTQRKATLTGAVSSINSDDLIATKNQNVQNSITGKIPGVRVVQKTSEPGEFNNQFDIRGFGNPLVVIDGIPRDNFARMDPNEIESISVLKDASAAIYGVRAANGVVLVTTKKGEEGKTRIEYTYNYGSQRPIELLKPVDAIDRMTLFNERTMHNIDNGTLKYPDSEFEAYRNGTKKSTDWYGETLYDSAPQWAHNVSASGSFGKFNFFASFAYTDQKGFFRSDALEYERYNARVNLNGQITNRLHLSIKINGIVDNRMRPQKNAWEIYKSLWRVTPDEPVYANDNPDYYYKVLADLHPIAASTPDISGYQQNQGTWLQNSFELKYDVPYVTGLTAKGMASYDMKFDDNSTYTKKYNLYTYNSADNTYSPTVRNSPQTMNRYYRTTPSFLLQFSLNYDRTFADAHSVNILALYEESQRSSDNFTAQRDLGIPIPYLFAGQAGNQQGSSNINDVWQNANRALVGKVGYSFKGKYIGEFSFRYDGSSKFPKDSRWGFFPAGQLGWRVSEEKFVKESDALSFISNLKVRGSYGKMGDDAASQYQFVTGYNYPVSGDNINREQLGTGYMMDGAFVPAVGFRAAPNPNITWYTVTTANIGLDASLWNGLLGVTIDVFKRDRDGLLANRIVSVPWTFGNSIAQENLNSDQTKGFEIELSHRSKVSDFHYRISGNLGFTRGMKQYIERSPSGNSWDNYRNNRSYRYGDVWFGWGAAGRFQSLEEIANYPVYTERGKLPGDYIYEDWNGDGTIDDLDRHPIATTVDADKNDFQDKRNYPLLNFGLTLSADYKGFDFSGLFQGAAMSYVSYGEQVGSPFAWDGNALYYFLDRWHPADPKADPWNPNTEWVQGYFGYTGSNADTNSSFMVQKGDYLRLKTVELGYTLPKTVIARVGIQNVRVYVNAYNLLTFSNVKGLDPEHPTETYGYMYPINKTYNFGINVTF